MFLVHRVPYPPNRGDRIRSYQLLRYLAKRANVSLATLADEPLEPGTLEVLQACCCRVAVESRGPTRWLQAAASLAVGGSATEGLFCSSQLARQIRQWSRETRWNAVVVFCSSMVQYLNSPELERTPTIIDLVDVDSQKFYDYSRCARGIKRWLYQLEGYRLRQLECSLPGRAKAITFVSQAEAELFRSQCPNDRTLALPNGVDLDYFRAANDGQHRWMPLPESQRTHLVFVGALDYHANVDGVTWFVNEVWSQVRQRWPHLTLGLVGRNPVSAIRRLAAKSGGVQLFGTVPDVRPYLAAADIAIAPLRIARGIQNKVLEAMAMAKPVICSPAALEGLSARPGRDLLVSGSAAEWVSCIQQLLGDDQLRNKVAKSARDFVESNHCWDAALHTLDAILQTDDSGSISGLASGLSPDKASVGDARNSSERLLFDASSSS